jgi:basic membrane protein A and related proteins
MKTRVMALGVGFVVALGLVSAQRMSSLGIVYNAQNKFDRSFNERAFEGANRASLAYKIGMLEYEPQSPDQIETGLRELSDAGMSMVIAVGFSAKDAVNKVAKNYSETRYVLLDDVPEGKNTLGLVFREEEGSFVVGAIAGRSTATNVVGFIGGMDVPLIHKFELGFTAGVKSVCPSCTVLAQYVGNDPSAWNNPQKATQISGEFAKRGADIYYAAAGGSGLGVLDFVKRTKCVRGSSSLKFNNNNIAANVPKEAGYAARCGTNSRPMFMIGVDSNQNYLGDNDATPRTMNYVLTSMEKRLDNAVYKLLSELNTGGTWKPGVRDFGLKEEGVGFSLDQYNRVLLPKATLEQVSRIKADIVAGKIRIPSKK